MIQSEQWNERKFGETPSYEVWYATWNHAATGQGFWLRFVIERDTHGHGRGEMWFARFDPHAPERTFGVHRRFAAESVRSSTAPFEIAIGNSRLSNSHAHGTFDGNGHAIAFDLRWEPAERVLKFFPDLAYPLSIGSTQALSPNARVPMTGSIVVDGERLAFDHVPFGQSHVWGTQHAFSWTWARCAEFAGASGVIELLAARVQRRGVTTPPLVMCTLELAGARYQFNQFRHMIRNRATWGGQRVTFSVQTTWHRLEGEWTCAPEQMVMAPYIDPDGTPVFCANTEIGEMRAVLSRRSGLAWREVQTLESHGRAHFEVGGRERDPAVTIDHVTV
ncbi:MAG TPA: tocopherol cyclase family protein [Kofleriaceae bacterium]